MARVWVYLPPGGQEIYFNPDASGAYPAHWNSRAVVVRVSDAPLRYERRLPDGTVEVYALSDGAPAGQRQIFLTSLIDPQGQRLDFTWDAQLRLLAITDAVGQVSTLEYADADLEADGAPGRIRTCDLWLRRPTLYPAELRAPRKGDLEPDSDSSDSD